jgi:hypothetical protein
MTLPDTPTLVQILELMLNMKAIDYEYAHANKCDRIVRLLRAVSCNAIESAIDDYHTKLDSIIESNKVCNKA